MGTQQRRKQTPKFHLCGDYLKSHVVKKVNWKMCLVVVIAMEKNEAVDSAISFTMRGRRRSLWKDDIWVRTSRWRENEPWVLWDVEGSRQTELQVAKVLSPESPWYIWGATGRPGWLEQTDQGRIFQEARELMEGTGRGNRWLGPCGPLRRLGLELWEATGEFRAELPLG